MPHIFKKYWALVLVCFIAGFIFILLLKTFTISKINTTDTRNETLIQIIENQEKEIANLETEIAQMRQTLLDSSAATGIDETLINDLKTQLENLQLIAGLTEVTGPGIVITLNDNAEGAKKAQNANPSNYYAEEFIIHDVDLRYLINEIAGFAEAISINNQRIINNSEIRCVGSVIMVNSTRLAPPYEIKFIGNVDKLETALKNSARYLYLKNKDMPITVTKVTSMILPAYIGIISTNYAKIEATQEATKK